MLESKKNLKLFLGVMLSIFMIASITFSNPIAVKGASVNGQAVVNEALEHLGEPYVYGAAGPNTFDCSGLTQYVYRVVAGIEIGRTTYNQINSGREVSQSELQPGDLVFTSADHVCIYIGNGEMVYAPKTGDVVKISSVYSFWRARRIIESSSSFDSILFSASFYANKYSDLKNAFGSNSNALYNHFKTYGIKEGRSASEVFDVNYYLNHNRDLINAFGSTNYLAAYNHFLSYGYKESRSLSPVFNMSTYIKDNPDVVNAYGTDYYGIMNHFLVYGMKEGRKASDNFDLTIYKNRYADLRNAFGDNNQAYYDHYLQYGIAEGRTAI